MRSRVLSIAQAFHRARGRLVTPSTPAAQGLAATIGRLLTSDLPGPQDCETLVPPVRRYWVRRVVGCNVWVLYTFTDDSLVLRTLVSSPPIPLD